MSNEEDDEIWSEDSGSDYNPKRAATKKAAVAVAAKRPSKSKSGSNSSNISNAVNSEYLEDIKQVFARFDTENAGKIETKQLKFAMRALGFEPKKEEVKRISEEYDKDGFIEYTDFVDLLVKRFTDKNVSEEIMKAFQLFDSTQSGKITFDDLKRVSNELGEKISDEELLEMIEEADLNGDKIVDSQEFLRIMKKTSLY